MIRPPRRSNKWPPKVTISAVRSTHPCHSHCRTASTLSPCSLQNCFRLSRAFFPNCFASEKKFEIFSLSASTSTPASLKSRPKTLSPPCRKVKTSSSTRNNRSHFAAASAVWTLNPFSNFTAPPRNDSTLFPFVARKSAVAASAINFSSCSTPPSLSETLLSHDVNFCAFPIRKSLIFFISVPMRVVILSISSMLAIQSPH